MSDDAFIVTGTPDGQWPAWLLPMLAERVDVEGGHAQALVMVEHPAHGLAQALTAGQATDPAAWLSDWRAAAQRLLRDAQRQPGKTLLVDAEEALQAPQALAACCKARLGIELDVERFAPPPAADPLARTLAECAIGASGPTEALLAELLACCQPLGDAADAEWAPPGWRERLEVPAAAVRLQALFGAEPAVAKVAAMQGELATLTRQAEGLGAQLGALLQERDALQQRADVLGAQLDALRLEAQAQASRQADELAAASSKQDALQQENELLLLQLHQVQEELEHYFLQARDLQAKADADAARAAPVPGVVEVAIGDIVPEAERDTPPHRELTFSVRQVRAGTREVVESTVRLVEHHGHPGLVVFGGGGDMPPLFAAWQPGGQEDGRPYALLIPSDAHSAPLLDAMDSADWLLLHTLVLRLERLLQAPPVPLQPHWSALARRLRDAMQDLPPRLRHQGLKVEPAADDGAQTLHFERVLYGARQLARVSVRWQPEQARLALLAGDAACGPPLPSWPCDAQGTPLPSLELPLSSRDADAHEPWRRLGAADRAFVLALLGAWPPTLGQVAGGSESLRAQAERMLAPLPHPGLRPGLFRRAARRVLRPRPAAART